MTSSRSNHENSKFALKMAPHLNAVGCAVLCGAAGDVLHYLHIIYELALKSDLTFWQVFSLFPFHITEEYIILS